MIGPPDHRGVGVLIVSSVGWRLILVVVVALTAVVLVARPAGAVTPRPTDDRSRVVAVDPAGFFTARIIGGDSLVEITVAPGHEVPIYGYGGEPYLRVPADGSVEVNRQSAAVDLNRDREADLTTASTAGFIAVDWQSAASGRTAVWHDHRIHAVPGAELTGPIDWQIPIAVDGEIHGQLERLAAPSPVPGLAVALLVAGAILLLGPGRPITTAAMALAAACIVAGITGYLEWRAMPAAVPRDLGLVLLPVGATCALILGVVVDHRPVRLVAMLISVSLLAGWLAFRWSILTCAVLISTLAPIVDRAGLSVVLGAVVAAAGLVVTWAGSVE